jgi:hypothetical protein
LFGYFRDWKCHYYFSHFFTVLMAFSYINWPVLTKKSSNEHWWWKWMHCKVRQKRPRTFPPAFFSLIFCAIFALLMLGFRLIKYVFFHKFKNITEICSSEIALWMAYI